MKKFKRIILSILISGLTIVGISFGIEAFPYSGIDSQPHEDMDFSGTLKANINDGDNGLKQLLNIFMPNNDMYDAGDGNPSFLFYLKTIINLLLSFVSLIALIFVIYAFYMIFFKKDEAGITTAKQIIKGIAIALFVIGLSWIIVSFLFRFEKENTQNVGYNNNTEVISSLT